MSEIYMSKGKLKVTPCFLSICPRENCEDMLLVTFDIVNLYTTNKVTFDIVNLYT